MSAAFSLFGSSSRPVNARGGGGAPALAGAAGGPTAQDADGKDGQRCGELAPRKLQEVPDQRPPARAGEPAAWRGRRAQDPEQGGGWGHRRAFRAHSETPKESFCCTREFFSWLTKCL